MGFVQKCIEKKKKKNCIAPDRPLALGYVRICIDPVSLPHWPLPVISSVRVHYATLVSLFCWLGKVGNFWLLSASNIGHGVTVVCDVW